jgi:hypothetical protein
LTEEPRRANSHESGGNFCLLLDWSAGRLAQANYPLIGAQKNEMEDGKYLETRKKAG